MHLLGEVAGKAEGSDERALGGEVGVGKHKVEEGTDAWLGGEVLDGRVVRSTV